MSIFHAVLGGAAGAAVLTAVHETVRRLNPDAPRMDLLGMRALARGFEAAGAEPPPPGELHTLALVGDLVSNAAYYTLVGSKPSAWARAGALGLAAGIGAVALPPKLGLGAAPSRRTHATAAMTVAWYTLGAFAAAAVARAAARA